MSWTSWPATEDDMSTTASMAVTSGPQSTGVVVAGGSNWKALPLGVFVVAGVTGNLLVCVAVKVERKLHNVTNYFLVSLAFADLLVSLVVMPCSIVQELNGYWPMGYVVCDVWQAMDVMLCTSSIWHMCTISIDRYIGIRYPLKAAAAARRSRAVGVKIGLVWFVSLLVTSPIIVIGFIHPEEIMSHDDLQCGITNRPFLVYGSIAAYFFPLGVMLVAYTASIRLLGQQGAWSRLRPGSGRRNGRGDADNGLRRSRSGRQTVVAHSGARTPELQVYRFRGDGLASRSAAGSVRSLRDRDAASDCVERQRSSTSQHDRSLSPLLSADNDRLPSTSGTPLPTLTGTGPARNVVIDDTLTEHVGACQSCRNPHEHGSDETGQEVTSPGRSPTGACTRSPLPVDRKSRDHVSRDLSPPSRSPTGACTRSPLPVDRKSRDHVSRDLSPPSPDDAATTTAVVGTRPVADDSPRSVGRASGRGLRSLVQKHALTIGAACELLSRRDDVRHQRSQIVATAAAAAAAIRNVRTERKAARVIGAVFAVFVACWTPFFVLNLSLGVCGPSCRRAVDSIGGLYSLFLWLGYVASTLNPIVYTVFNGTFRCTFADLLTCRRRPCSSRAHNYAASRISLRRQNSAV